MSENNNRLPGQAENENLPGQQTPAARSPEDFLAQVDSFAAEMLNNMLSELESSVSTVSTAPHQSRAAGSQG